MTSPNRAAIGTSSRSGPRVFLALGVHDHQPIGNFGWVFRKHYEEAYRPFLDTMCRHPLVPFSLHTSGPLLEWLTLEAPDYVALLHEMVGRGQVEMKGGAFYEPILALLPDADKTAQLRLMTQFLFHHLGVTPSGAWLAERVWEPHLARPLAQSGLEYAVLDDFHFLAAGLAPEDTLGYYVTEEEGYRFDLFPISKELRYLIPFHDPEEVIGFLRSAQDRLSADLPPPLFVYDDDGEKFGGWPGTNRHVYGGGWLEGFVAALERETEAGWLEVVTLGGYRQRFSPLGRIYLLGGSYAEMQEWSGGNFRNFLVRYSEANRLHKRMLLLSGRARHPTGADAPQENEGAAAEQREEAYKHVLRAQCNDAYWHGVFGGLYLPHLRHAAYADLLSAERLLPSATRPSIEVLDYDLDGADEVFLRSEELTAIVAPAAGGTMVALDHLPTAFALMDTLQRRREHEHEALERLAADVGARTDAGPAAGANADALAGADARARAAGDAKPAEMGASTIHETVRVKEPGLEKLLFQDRLPRTSFHDRFLGCSSSWRDMQEARVLDWGDFAGNAYNLESWGACAALEATGPALTSGQSWAGGPWVRLTRAGTVAGKRVIIVKRTFLATDAAGLELLYQVQVGEDEPETTTREGAESLPATVLFAPELNLTLLAGWSTDRYVLVDGHRPLDSFLAAGGSHARAESLAMVDESVGVRILVRWHGSLWKLARPSTVRGGTDSSDSRRASGGRAASVRRCDRVSE